jgi:hypothetical protein
VRVHLEDGDVGRRVDADESGFEALVVREADLDRARARDHVVVRDDVAGLVDHEADPRAFACWVCGNGDPKNGSTEAC